MRNLIWLKVCNLTASSIPGIVYHTYTTKCVRLCEYNGPTGQFPCRQFIQKFAGIFNYISWCVKIYMLLSIWYCLSFSCVVSYVWCCMDPHVISYLFAAVWIFVWSGRTSQSISYCSALWPDCSTVLLLSTLQHRSFPGTHKTFKHQLNSSFEYVTNNGGPTRAPQTCSGSDLTL